MDVEGLNSHTPRSCTQLSPKPQNTACDSSCGSHRPTRIMPHSLSSSPIEDLPLETLQRIFELACTDGGYTGNSLSLVSKGIRAAARTTRFHSISLIASPHGLQLFVALYERECDPGRGDKPRIQHLHVAFPSIPPECRSYSSSSCSLEPAPVEAYVPVIRRSGYIIGTRSQPSILKRSILAIKQFGTKTVQRLIGHRRITRRHKATPSHANTDYLGPKTYREYISKVQALFRLAAADLVTLVVQCGDRSRGPPDLTIIEQPFPSLLEATFVGFQDSFLLISPDIDLATMTPLFPAMTHLHVAPTLSGRISLPLWFIQAPYVTHLCVSRAEKHLQEIASAVGVRIEPIFPTTVQYHLPHYDTSGSGAPSDRSQVPRVPAYPSVRHLLVQPSSSIASWCGYARMVFIDRMSVLRQIECSCEAMGIEAFEADPPGDGFFPCDEYEPARRRWIERMHDGRDAAGGWRGRARSVSSHGSPQQRMDSSEGTLSLARRSSSSS